MFQASSVLLLTLVLNVQLCSSAPIPAKAAQSSGPGPEKLAPVTEAHSHFIEEKEPVQEKLIPVVAGVAAPSPEESPAEEDIPVIAKEPEPIFIGDQVSDDADEADESQESAPQEPLAAASQESSEEGTFNEEAAFAEASPEETTEDVAVAAAVESEQHYGEDSAPEVLIPVIHLEASKYEAPEENAEEETTVAVESAPPEQYLEDPVPGAPIPIIPAGASEDEASVENAAEEAAPEEALLIVPDDNTEVEPAALTPAEEKSVLVPAELEESAPEEPAVIVPVEPAEQELDQEETLSIISSEIKEEEDSEENAKEEEEAVAPVVLEGNAEEVLATNEEPFPSTLEESVAPFPVELETEEEGQVESVAEQTAPQESAPGDPVVIVPLDPAEDEPELEVQVKEESIPIASPESPEEEALEEAAGVPVSIVPEENAEEVPATNKEPFPSTLIEEESVALFPVEFNTEEEGQVEPVAEQTAPQESAPGDSVVIVPLDPAEDEPELEVQVTEESIPIASPESPEEEAPEEAAGVPVSIVPEENAEEVPATNEEPFPSTLKEEESVALFPVEFNTEEEGQVEPVAEQTAPQESAPGDPVVIVPLDPAGDEPELEVQVTEESIPIASPESPEEEAPEEAAGVPVSIVPEYNAEEVPATKKEPFPTTLKEEESVALFPVEFNTEEEGQVEPVAELTAPQESAPGDPVVVVPLDPAEEEPELEVQVTEESIPIASPESPEEEAPEEAAGVPVPILLGENAEEDHATNEEPLAGAPEEEQSVVLDTEEEVQVEQAAQETEPALEKPAVSVVVEPTSEEPAPEDPIIPLKDLEEDAPDDNTEDVVQSDPLLTETALEEDTADAEILVTSATETSSENDTIETALDPGEEVAATEVPASILTEAPIEPVTAPPAPAVSEAQIVLAPLEGGDGTSMKTRSEDFSAVAILIEDEPVVLVNRGTVLGAAFFTLMSFIVTGFLGTTIYKKLR